MASRCEMESSSACAAVALRLLLLRFLAPLPLALDSEGEGVSFGEITRVLRVRVADVLAYDRFYQRLIEKVQIADVSASFVMEDVKETTALPV